MSASEKSDSGLARASLCILQQEHASLGSWSHQEKQMFREAGPRSLQLQTLGPGTQEAEARGSWVLDQLELYSKPHVKK